MSAKPKIFAFAVCLVAVSAGISFRGANDEPAVGLTGRADSERWGGERRVVRSD